MSDLDEDYLEGDIEKRNRRVSEEAEENRMVVGPRPPTATHVESRKQRDKRRNLVIKKALK